MYSIPMKHPAGIACRGIAPWLVTALLAMCLLPGFAPQATAQVRPPVPIIFDTDMESDVDDVGALAMLHALADRGEAEILGVMVSAKNPDSAACADRINTYFGRPDIPIGNVKGEGVLRESRYAGQVAKEFPGALQSDDVAPDAVGLYRKILAAQPDHSVVVVTVGYKTNLRDLLASGACAHSDLDGAELVRQKVRLWVCMGGQFPKGREANIRWDAAASAEALAKWPTEVVFSGWEIGRPVMTGGRLRELPEDSPVRRSYDLFKGLEAHYSWDQAAVLYAVRALDGGPAAEHWELSPPGRIVVDPEDGSNTWQSDSDGMHRHKIARRDPELIAQEIDELMMHTPSKPVAIIFDTDMDTDVDDVGALAVLHALADLGEAGILAVIHSAPAPDGPVCAQAVNAWYGRPELPVGWTDWPEFETSPVYATYRRARQHIANTGADYVPVVAATYRAAMGGQTPPVQDGVKLYRQTLTAAEDGSVVICTVGMLSAVAGLIESGPDEISPLTGRELVAKKVKRLVTMALGHFPEGRDGFNWLCDVPSAAKVLNNWPVALAVMPHGETILTGGRLVREGDPENPCVRAYDIYVKNPGKARSSWDLCAVLYAVRGPGLYFQDKPGHRLEMDGNEGTHRWVADAASPQVYIEQVVDDAKLVEALEGLLLRAPSARKAADGQSLN